jgi:hypothetical protein
MRAVALLALCLATLLTGAGANPLWAADIESPPKGSPLRTTLLNVARPTFEQEIGGPIEFVVSTLNVWGQWAYGDVKLQRPGGQPINWRKTKFAEDLAQGMLETEHNLFLLQEGPNGWTLVEHAIGPTDVAWDWWRQQRKLPYELFGAAPEDFAPTSRPRAGG